MNTPTKAALDVAGVILSELPNIAAVLNEVNNLDGDSQLRARCYQAAVESIAKHVQAAINVAEEDKQMLDWLGGRFLRISVIHGGRQILEKGYWPDDIRKHLKTAMEEFPSTGSEKKEQ